MNENDWNDLLNVEWDGLPFSHERDDGLGWYYRDEPHGGFLVVAETEAYFHENDEEIEVRLGIGVEFIDWEAAVGEPGYLAAAYAAVHPDCLTESSLRDVLGSEADDPDVTPTYYDVQMYGYAVKIGEGFSEDGWEPAYEEVKPNLALADFGVGFLLDKPYNRLGTTGWDLVRDAAADVDAHEASMERLREHHEA